MSSPFVLIIIIIVFIFLARGVWGIRQKVVVSNTKYESIKKELDRLQSRKQDLADRINYLSTDQGIEAELKSRYGAVRNGESVAVIIDQNSQSANALQVSSTSPLGSEGKKSFLDRVFGIFGF